MRLILWVLVLVALYSSGHWILGTLVLLWGLGSI